MIIQTIDQGYEVTRVLRSGEDRGVYLCRSLERNDEGGYLLVCLKDMELIRRAMPVYTAQLRCNPAFEDFVTCFAQQGQAYLVFRDKELPRLAEQLESERYSLRERMEIGHNLLEKMALQNMPPYLQYEALTAQNVRMGDSLAVSFRYDLEEFSDSFHMNDNAYQAPLHAVFSLLFRTEALNQVCPELNAFLNRLQQQEYADYLEIFKDYSKVYQAMELLLKNGGLTPRSLPFRIWDKIKSLSRFVRPVAAGLLLVILAAYLIYTLLHPTRSANSLQAPITQIGTVSIE